MFNRLAIAAVLLIVVLAQAPGALSTVRSILGLDSWGDWWSRDAITSSERAGELAAKGLREQLISFSEGLTNLEYRRGAKLESQSYDIYAIGVGQVTLNSPEEKLEKVTVTGSRLPPPQELPDANTLPTTPIMGQFNNIILFDRRSGEMAKLFDRRIAISQFQYGWRTTPEVLVMFATETDSNKDGKLDDNDLHDIYVYTFADRKLHKVDAPGINPQEVVDIPDVGYVIVKALVDHDHDGKTIPIYSYGGYNKNQEPEPTTLLRIDLKTFTAAPFVAQAMLDDLQTTLDGPKPASPAKPTGDSKP